MPHTTPKISPFSFRELLRSVPSPMSRLLTKPPYQWRAGVRVGLAVESMKDHMTDEGWQLMLGIRHGGYILYGKGIDDEITDVRHILRRTDPSVMIVMDKREWDRDPQRRDFRDKEAYFHHVGELKDRTDIFKLTVLKDAHQRPEYHRNSADEMGVHAWVTYYHPATVRHCAPYVREEHLVRTYHSVDRDLVPKYDPNGRSGAVLSGAVSPAYPLRRALVRNLHLLPQTLHLTHPGYHRNGCHTPQFLKSLSIFKVSICTSSMYGYALRKIVESTACGCVVVTDLPEEDKLPFIDGNLVRVRPSITPQGMAEVIREQCESYDPERQYFYANLACGYYDYRETGQRLADDIERLRGNY